LDTPSYVQLDIPFEISEPYLQI